MTWRVFVHISEYQIEARQLRPDEDRLIEEMPLPALIAVSWVEQLAEDRWPAPQGASTGNLVIRFARASQVGFISGHSGVLIEFYRDSDDTEPAATFTGRASDPEFTAHDKGVDARFSIVDLLSDLGDTVGDAPYPQENVRARLNRMFTEAGFTNPDTTGYSDVPALAARDSNPQSLLSLAQEALSWAVWNDTASGEPTMLELRPVGFFDWTVTPVPTHADAEGILVIEQETFYVVPVPAVDPSAVISASWIVAGSSWKRRPPSLPTATATVLTATKERRTASLYPERLPTPRLRIESQLVDVADAQRLANYHILADDIVYRAPEWEAHDFTIDLNRAPANWWVGKLRDVRVITGLQARHHPDDTEWTAGVITSRELRIEQGRAYVDVTLAIRPIRDGVSIL